MAELVIIAFVAAVLRFFGILVFSLAVAAPNGLIFVRDDKGPWKRKNYVVGAVAAIGFYVFLWATRDPAENISPWNFVFIAAGLTVVLFVMFVLVVGAVLAVWRNLPT